MQDVFRPAAQHVEHVFEGLEARLVGLRLLGGVDGMERRAELFDIGHDLRVHCIRQDDERDFLRDLGETGRNVRMRPPGRHALIDHLRVLRLERDAIDLAGPLQRIVDHLGVGLPVAEDLVEPVGGEIADEGQHPGFFHAIAIEVAGGLPHLETGQRAVAVEGDEFRAKGRHGMSSIWRRRSR